jgi:hypothetical protein
VIEFADSSDTLILRQHQTFPDLTDEQIGRMAHMGVRRRWSVSGRGRPAFGQGGARRWSCGR